MERLSDTTNITLQSSTGDGLFLRIDRNLADVPDKKRARDNLQLKSAATLDAQTSRDDVTAGRLLVNGGAVAVRSAYANGSSGAPITDVNDLPVNAVSAVWNNPANSPGYDATLLDVSGLNDRYRTQYAASYLDGGKRFKFRTLNGQNNTWGVWNEVYHTGNKPTTSDVGAYPLTGGTLNGNLYATGIVQSGPGKDVVSQNDVWAAHFIYENGQRVYSPNNPPPAPDLSVYARQDWVMNYTSPKNTANFVSGWWRCASTGRITQWGVVTRAGYTTNVVFPLSFPNACFGVSATPRNYVNSISSAPSNIRATDANKTGFSYLSESEDTQAFWVAEGY